MKKKEYIKPVIESLNESSSEIMQTSDYKPDRPDKPDGPHGPDDPHHPRTFSYGYEN